MAGHPWAAVVSAPRRRPEEAGILHLGLGSFHRAHQAVYTAAALDREPGPWGITGVASRSRAVVDALKRQDRKYGVLTMGPEGSSVDVIGVHRALYTAAEDPTRLAGDLAAPATRIVTLTVTERGYSYSPTRDGLDLDAAPVRQDLAGAPPRTVVGQLAGGLAARFRAGGAPLAVVSCDNLSENGRMLRRLVHEFVSEAGGPDAGDLLTWLDREVAFPCTMVDRIVPATEDRHRELSVQLTGRPDRVPVPAEPFSMWVLEDLFPAGRPAWEAGGAVFTDRVRDYELLKLRMLNASNSLLAYLGLLRGEATIASALGHPPIRRVVEQLMRPEMLSTFAVPDDVDAEEYAAQLLTRFGNAAIGHRTGQVGSDGSHKIPIRVSEPVLHHHARGQVPGATALLVAAFIRTFSDPTATVLPQDMRALDPRADDLAELRRRHTSPEDLARAVIIDSGIFPRRLAEATGWVARVGELLAVLADQGVDAAAGAALD